MGGMQRMEEMVVVSCRMFDEVWWSTRSSFPSFGMTSA
jgi:hypothetical protein